MSARATITVLKPREQVEQLWGDPGHLSEFVHDLATFVRFVSAPGDRGTEIHVDLGGNAPANRLTEVVRKVRGDEPVAKVKDELRRFKQLVETGEITRSEAVPGGEALEAKRRRRPAQPLPADELSEVKG